MKRSTCRMFCEAYVLSCLIISLSLSSVSCCVRWYNMSVFRMCNATLNSFLCKEAMLVLYYPHTSHLTQREISCPFCPPSVSFSLSLWKVKEWGHAELKWQRQHKNPHCFKCSHLHPLIFFHITHLPDIFVLSCLHSSLFLFYPKPLSSFSHLILTIWSSSLSPNFLLTSIIPPSLKNPSSTHHQPPSLLNYIYFHFGSHEQNVVCSQMEM